MRLAAHTLTLTLAVSACVGLPGDPSSPPTAPPTAKLAAPATFRIPQSDAFGNLLKKVAGDFNPADSELNTMWSDIFRTTQVDGQRPYGPPTGAAPYETGDVPPIACAQGSAARDWPRGAFYCPSDGWIVYDEQWLREFQGNNGDFAPAAVLAHEWGHHVQSLFPGSEHSIQRELQADCFAGMYMNYRELGDTTKTRAQQDAEFAAALVSFFNLANKSYSDSSWFQADEHGSQFQRMLAFGTGQLPIGNGLDWCYGYTDFKAGDVAQIGPYRFVNLPGRSASFSGDTYVIQPETRLSNDTSRISIEWLPTLPLDGEGPTLEQVTALAKARMPRAATSPPGIDLTGSVSPGTGWMALYDSSDPAAPRSGFIAVLTPHTLPGGLVVDVSRDSSMNTDPASSPSPETWQVLAEQFVAIYQVTARLCGPDQSDVLPTPSAATNWSMACVADQ